MEKLNQFQNRKENFGNKMVTILGDNIAGGKEEIVDFPPVLGNCKRFGAMAAPMGFLMGRCRSAPPGRKVFLRRRSQQFVRPTTPATKLSPGAPVAADFMLGYYRLLPPGAESGAFLR
jgi:hypothetical protein